MPGTAHAAPAERVVSVNLCTDEYVFRLVPRARIAALSFLAGDRNPIVSTIVDEVGGIALIRQSAEDILAVTPDLVVMDEGVGTRIRAVLAQAKIPVLDVSWVGSIAGIREVTRKLSLALGVPEKGEGLLAEMDARLAAARADRAADPPVRTLVYQPNGYTVAGGLTDEIMEIAGLENAAPAMTRTRLGTIPIEAVIASAPELLVLGDRAETRNSRAHLVLHHPALGVLEGRTQVTWISTAPLLCPGPWSAMAAGSFAKAGRDARSALKR